MTTKHFTKKLEFLSNTPWIVLDVVVVKFFPRDEAKRTEQKDPPGDKLQVVLQQYSPPPREEQSQQPQPQSLEQQSEAFPFLGLKVYHVLLLFDCDTNSIFFDRSVMAITL